MINLIIVEDDEKLRKAYSELIDSNADMKCCGSFSNVKDALVFLSKNKIDVVLMDIGLPDIDGIEGVKRIKLIYSEIHVLMLTVFEDDDKIFQAICSGASGYMLKNTPVDELISGIQNIATSAPMSATIAKKVLSMFRSFTLPPENNFNLTMREKDILHFLVGGLSYKTIAAKLFISHDTVHTHIKNIYEKLQVHSKSEAVSKAMKHRLI